MAKSYLQLVPSVERRLSTWLSLSEKRPGPNVAPRPTITISRRFGCEAYPLAERLKEILDRATAETWNIYDKALLERVSRDENLSLSLLEKLGGPSGAMDSLLYADHLAQDLAFKRIVHHMMQLARLGNAILVGRGAPIVTQRFTNCYHFRLDADFDFRVASLVKRLEMTRKEAERLVRDSDRSREKFIEDRLGVSVSDLGFYDAVFNNARQDINAIAHAIVSYVAARWPERRYFAASRGAESVAEPR